MIFPSENYYYYTYNRWLACLTARVSALPSVLISVPTGKQLPAVLCSSVARRHTDKQLAKERTVIVFLSLIGATSFGEPWPPWQSASNRLDPLLLVSILLHRAYTGRPQDNPTIVFWLGCLPDQWKFALMWGCLTHSLEMPRPPDSTFLYASNDIWFSIDCLLYTSRCV